MSKHNPSESFGVFKPVGHTVIAFSVEADMQSAVIALKAQGFVDADFIFYTPQEMVSQVDMEVQNAGLLAPFGYELALVKAHRVQAQQGCHFLVVCAPKSAQSARVAAAANDNHAVSAQHYGRLMIEELAGLELGDARVV